MDQALTDPSRGQFGFVISKRVGLASMHSSVPTRAGSEPIQPRYPRVDRPWREPGGALGHPAAWNVRLPDGVGLTG